jgi:hypothetical protein
VFSPQVPVESRVKNFFKFPFFARRYHRFWSKKSVKNHKLVQNAVERIENLKPVPAKAGIEPP